MTYIEAAVDVLRTNSNRPMSYKEIWTEISQRNLMKSEGKTPWSTLCTQMLATSTNSTLKSKSRKTYFTIVGKNPIKFIIKDDEQSTDDFNLTDEEIVDNFSSLISATLEIKNCINDITYLCDLLKTTELAHLKEYYSSDNNGFVIDIRKEVAKEALLGSITPDKLESIIQIHKSNNPQSLKTWSNPYRIIHPLINHRYKYLDQFIQKFSKYISTKIGNVDYTISNFNGSQHQGSDQYWVAFYNKSHKSQSEGLQLFLNFKDGLFTIGIYNFLENIHSDIITFNNNIDLDKLYDFININSEIILNDTLTLSENLILKVKKLIEKNQNFYISTSEIIKSLNSNISESNLIKILEECDEFETEDGKWRIKGQIPGTSKIKQYLTEQGFVTVDMLLEILKKHGIETIDI